MQPFDIYTVYMLSTFIVFSISVATFIFSLVRKENRFFFWAAAADFMFAASFISEILRNILPHTVVLMVSLILSTFGMIGYYELYCHLVDSKPGKRYRLFIFLALLVVGIVLTLMYPEFQTRILINDMILLVISVLLIHFIVSNAPRPLLAVHILVAAPFINLIIIAVTRGTVFLVERTTGALPATEIINLCLNTVFFITIIYISVASIFLISTKLHFTLLGTSRRDPLTSAYNRSALTELFERELSLARRYGDPLNFIICDIDFFKKVNDTHGHIAGDAVLVHVVGLLRESIRSTDLLARYGGEEFAVVLPRTENKNALMLAGRLREYIENNPAEYEGRKISVTCSFGISCFNAENDSYEDIVKRADTALYRAKANGRNRVEQAEE